VAQKSVNQIHFAIPSTKTYAGDILVVDDMPDNLRLLSTILTEHDYKVRRVMSGKLALDAISINPPELILLDILMPDMSGFEVCEQLKANPQTASIPVIFLSALNDSHDKAKAFSLGGADYITKPFQILEVLARVNHQITITRQRQELVKREQELSQLNQILTARVDDRTMAIERLLNQLQLQIRDRTQIETESKQQNLELEQVKTRFAQQIFHEFRTPLSIISLSADSLANNSLSPEERSRRLQQILSSVNRLNQILTNFAALELSVDRHSTRNLPKLDLNQFFYNVISDWQRVAGDRFKIEYLPQSNLPTAINLEPLILYEILEQIINNSIRFSPNGGTIKIKVAINLDLIIISIQDSGIGIPEDELEKVFDQFYRAGNADTIVGTPGIGIGLTIAKQLIDLQGGDISIISQEHKGTTVNICLSYVAA
jgi:two-component system, sensor histidine kinase and response regulator